MGFEYIDRLNGEMRLTRASHDRVYAPPPLRIGRAGVASQAG
jgi:hypothetical protein